MFPDTVGTGVDSQDSQSALASQPDQARGPAALGVATRHARVSSRQVHSEMQPGITLRDLVNAIPYAAIQRAATVEKEGKECVSGRI